MKQFSAYSLFKKPSSCFLINVVNIIWWCQHFNLNNVNAWRNWCSASALGNYFKVQFCTFLVVNWQWRFPKSVSIDGKYVRVQIKVLHRFWRNTMHLVFHDSSFFFNFENHLNNTIAPLTIWHCGSFNFPAKSYKWSSLRKTDTSG